LIVGGGPLFVVFFKRICQIGRHNVLAQNLACAGMV
jgi:hypothetical protein